MFGICCWRSSFVVFVVAVFSVYMRVWLVSIGWLFMFRSHFFMLEHRDDSLHCKTEICFDLVFFSLANA